MGSVLGRLGSRDQGGPKPDGCTAYDIEFKAVADHPSV